MTGAQGGLNMSRLVSMFGMACAQGVALVALATVAQAQPTTCNNRTLSSGGTIVPQNTPFTVSGSVTATTGTYYTVTASANASYTFTFCSNGGTSSYDPWLCLYNSGGSLLVQNDDSCGLQSQIVQTLTTGTYYIAVSGFSTSSGSYTLAYFAPGVIPNLNPNAPTNLVHAAVSNGPPKGVGFVSDATAYFRATVTDNDTGDLVGVQVEVLPSAVPFDPSNITGQTASTPVSSMVGSGGTPECVYTFTGNPFGAGDYHWRLRGIDDNGGAGAWVVFNAVPVHFTVDLDPPSTPVGPYNPGEGDGVGVVPPGSDVLFTWGIAVDVGPPGPISYRVQVSASPDFSNNFADDVVPALEFRVPLNIAATPYYWRVAAVDQGGNQGPFTLPISFLVIFNDPTNHAGGDCNISVGAATGPLVPAAFAAALLAFGLARRRRA